MNITDSDLKGLKKLNFGNDTFNSGGSIYQFDSNTLYKNVDPYFFIDEVERNVDFQIENHVPCTPSIYEKIYYKDKFWGYSMECLKNTITFKNASYLHIDFYVCLKIIQDIYMAIKYLHQRNILLGDIHMDNFLIDTNGCGYMIDLDYMISRGDEYKFQDLYQVQLKPDGKRIQINSKNTDNIKAMICCLSLIFGIDLESKNIYQSCINMEDLYYKYIQPLGIVSLDDYFSRIIQGEEVEYFDDFIKENYTQFLDNGCVKNRKK